jgi:hypothetical protein
MMRLRALTRCRMRQRRSRPHENSSQAVSQEEQRLYRGPVDRDPMVPLGAFVIVALICLATIAALVF